MDLFSGYKKHLSSSQVENMYKWQTIYNISSLRTWCQMITRLLKLSKLLIRGVDFMVVKQQHFSPICL